MPPILSPNATDSEAQQLTSVIKQNGVLWIECASKVSVFIKEAQECID